MNNKAKSIWYLIIICIVLLIGCCSLLMVLLYRQSPQHEISYIYDDSVYDDNLIYPSHIHIIYNNYDGDISLKTINKSINYFFSNVIIDLYNKFRNNNSEDAIQKYFNENKSTIGLVSGIVEYEDFHKLIKKITQFDTDNLVLKRIEIDSNDYGTNEDVFECIIEAYYENNYQLSFRTLIEGDIINKKISPIQYTILE